MLDIVAADHHQAAALAIDREAFGDAETWRPAAAVRPVAHVQPPAHRPLDQPPDEDHQQKQREGGRQPACHPHALGAEEVFKHLHDGSGLSATNASNPGILASHCARKEDIGLRKG
jgi:hypothetical protein